MSSNNNNKDFLNLKFLKKRKDTPSEIRISSDGSVYIDGKLYDGKNSKYKNLSIDVEKHNKLSTGEETQKIIESSKKAEKGETVVIKDVKTANRKESTSVTF